MVADNSINAVAEIVDLLLDSRPDRERWGLQWRGVARYGQPAPKVIA